MAWIHFCTANHNSTGRLTLVDMSNWFEAGLLDLGHKVTFSDSHLESGAINILWDYFKPNFMRELAESGVTYGLAATEIPDGTTFNWRTEPEWQSRFDNFNKVAKGASFIWAQIECTMPYYSQFAPTAFTALGFSERLVPNYIDQAPERDFCFFGLHTPYRDAAIARLRRHATVEWPDTILTPEGVGQLIASSRIGISFKQSPQWPVPSPPRLGRLMLAKRGIAAEHVPIPTQQGTIVGLCPPDRDFTEYALEILSSDWRQRADEVFATYRERMPMRLIMERALDESLVVPHSTGISPRSDELHGATESQRVVVTREHALEYLGQLGTTRLFRCAEKFVGMPIHLAHIDPSFLDLAEVPLVFASRAELEEHVAKMMVEQARARQPLRRLRSSLARLFQALVTHPRA